MTSEIERVSEGGETAPVSLLYVPAHKPRALAKARALAADMIVIDLEDAVPPEAKTAGRENAVAAIDEGFPDKRVALRVNAGDADDLAAAIAARPDFVVVPKVDGPGDLPDCAIPLMAMIETPKGVLAAPAIAADARIAGLIAGLNDLGAALHLPAGAGRGSMTLALQTIVLAARAAGVWCFDGVTNAIDDAQAFARDAADGHRLGFDGKSLIHPSQIDACHAAWEPDAAAIDEARRMIAAVTDARGTGATGAVRFAGRMVEDMHIAAARRILARADLRRAISAVSRHDNRSVE